MLHMDGFEQYAGEPSLTIPLGRAQYSVSGTWGAVSGRGTNSRAIAGQGCFIQRRVDWKADKDKLSFGFACNFTARGSMAVFKCGGVDLTFWINSVTGMPQLNNVVGGALPTKSLYYYYEIEIDRASGLCSLFINNRFDCSISFGPGSMSAEFADIRLGFRAPHEYRPGVTPVPTDTGVKNYDDFYIRDNTRFGPIMISTRFPDIDVVTDWFKAGDESTHAATLARLPPEPLDRYVAADTIGKEERFISNDPLANTNSVIATGLVVMARKSPSLNAKLEVFMAGTVTQRGDKRAVESEWLTQFVCFEFVQGDTIQNVQNSTFGVSVSAP